MGITDAFEHMNYSPLMERYVNIGTTEVINIVYAFHPIYITNLCT